VAEAILFGGTLPVNRRRIERESPGTKKGEERLSWEDHSKPYPTLVTIRIISRKVWIWKSEEGEREPKG
jgi:hypothetical protein